MELLRATGTGPGDRSNMAGALALCTNWFLLDSDTGCAHCRLLLCCKNGGVLGGPFLSYGTAHHTFCHMTLSASFAMQSAVRIPSCCTVPHWRALNGFPPAATLSIGTEGPCCAVTTLHCPSPTSPLGFAGPDLVICVRPKVICYCRSGMSSPLTTPRTVVVFFLVPTRAPRVFLIFWSMEHSPSPPHLRNS